MFPSASGLSRGYSGIHSKKRSQMAAALSFPYCPKICIGDWPLGKRGFYADQSLLDTTVTHPTLLVFKFGSDLNNATPKYLNTSHATAYFNFLFLVYIISTQFSHSMLCTLHCKISVEILQSKPHLWLLFSHTSTYFKIDCCSSSLLRLLPNIKCFCIYIALREKDPDIV